MTVNYFATSRHSRAGSAAIVDAIVEIREIRDADWASVWTFMEPIIRAGETYPYAMDMTMEVAREMWLDIPEATYVAEDAGGRIVGTYYLKPNQPTLGAHVANCGYMVAENAQGKGAGAQMCQHSQDEALRLGYRAIQYNLVVATNDPSVHLWQKMGFDIVGTLPGAFRRSGKDFVDAYVMYKVLVDEGS